MISNCYYLQSRTLTEAEKTKKEYLEEGIAFCVSIDYEGPAKMDSVAFYQTYLKRLAL